MWHHNSRGGMACGRAMPSVINSVLRSRLGQPSWPQHNCFWNDSKVTDRTYIQRFSTLRLLTSQWWEHDTHSAETALWILNVDLFTARICSIILPRGWAEVASSHVARGWTTALHSVLCGQHFLDIVFSHPIMSTKCPAACPASGEKRKAITLEMYVLWAGSR